MRNILECKKRQILQGHKVFPRLSRYGKQNKISQGTILPLKNAQTRLTQSTLNWLEEKRAKVKRRKSWVGREEGWLVKMCAILRIQILDRVLRTSKLQSLLVLRSTEDA